MQYHPKPIFIERIKKLLNNEGDVQKFFELAKTKPKKSFRANTLKISPEELKERLIKKSWEISQPIRNHPEIFTIESQLKPGEIGKTKEHILGYYYIQEITSMMPIIALNLKPTDNFLDLCAAPGSKTSQAVALMKNQGIIIANDVSISRVSILSSNLERINATNCIITKHEGIQLCERLKKFSDLKFNKILVDAPCSGEGNIRTSPRTYLEWSENLLKRLGKKQKKIASKALDLLEVGGEMIYSTCTYAPEENEEVIQYLIENHNIKIEGIALPIKSRPGLSEWKNKKFSDELKKAHRIYHHDNDLEGFFLCKIKKIKNN